MMNDVSKLIERLGEKHSLSVSEYETLVEGFNEENAEILRQYADKERRAHYGNKIFIRGLIEVSNICKNDCYYCGIAMVQLTDTGLQRMKSLNVWMQAMNWAFAPLLCREVRILPLLMNFW